MNKVALVLLFLLLCPPLVNAQTTLQTGAPVERELANEQVHEFNVRVEENEYVALVVEQRGIDVIVRVTSPAGKSVGQFDSPTGGEGQEHVSFVALAGGRYTVTVAPLNPAHGQSGRYTIKLLEVRQATDQELKARKNLAVVKARGITLLTEIEGLVSQIKSHHTRIRAQVHASKILWTTDEKRAAKSLTNAIADFKEFMGTVDPADANYQQYSSLFQLRQEIIQILAERDPDVALDFLYSTSNQTDPFNNQHERMMHESALELTIVDQIATRQPERALQLARKTLKNRYSPNLLGTVMQLQSKNRDLAAELTNEIAAKLLSENILRNAEAANLAMGLLRFSHDTQQQETGDAKPVPGLLPEEMWKELLQKMLNEVSSYSNPSPHAYAPERAAAWNILSGLQSMAPQLEALAPGSVAMVQKKLMDMNGGINPYAESPVQTMIGTNSVEQAMEEIEKAPEEMRESLYMQLAHREMNSGDVTRAKQILKDHITNFYVRRQVLTGIEQADIHRAINAGQVEDALRSVGGISGNRERAASLSQIVGRIGPGHKRAEALNLLQQARSMLGPSIQAQDETHMMALLEIARAFARYDVKRSFEIVDPLLDQFNELSAAARVLNGFGSEVFQNDELDLQSGNSIGNIASTMSAVLGELALINFDRSKLAAEKIRLPEVRLRVYLDIAEKTVNATGEK